MKHIQLYLIDTTIRYMSVYTLSEVVYNTVVYIHYHTLPMAKQTVQCPLALNPIGCSEPDHGTKGKGGRPVSLYK